MQSWSECVALHEMWKEYVRDVLQLVDVEEEEQSLKGRDTKKEADYDKSNTTSNLNEKLTRCDFHGALLSVIKSKIPSNIGKSGIVVKETENMFYMIGRDSEVIVMKKKNQVFGLQVSSTYYAQIFGES